MPDVVITGKTSGPCGCCHSTPVDCFRVRSRGGAQSACGWERPDGNFYRSVALAGEVRFCQFLDSGGVCTRAVELWSVRFAGSCSYDVTTCSETIGGTVSFWTGGLGGGPPDCSGATLVLGTVLNQCDMNPDGSSWPFSAWPAGVILTQTTLVDTLTGDDLCYDWPGSGSAAADSHYSATATYSDQDTASDIYARAVAAAAADPWGFWMPAAVGFPVAGAIEASPNSYYQEGQFKISASGLLHSHDYSTEVNVYRSTDGISWSLYETLTVSGMTDSSGNLLIQEDVPNDLGFYTYVTCDCVLTPA